jgi:hypothetical protein
MKAITILCIIIVSILLLFGLGHYDLYQTEYEKELISLSFSQYVIAIIFYSLFLGFINNHNKALEELHELKEKIKGIETELKK